MTVRVDSHIFQKHPKTSSTCQQSQRSAYWRFSRDVYDPLTGCDSKTHQLPAPDSTGLRWLEGWALSQVSIGDLLAVLVHATPGYVLVFARACVKKRDH